MCTAVSCGRCYPPHTRYTLAVTHRLIWSRCQSRTTSHIGASRGLAICFTCPTAGLMGCSTWARLSAGQTRSSVPNARKCTALHSDRWPLDALCSSSESLCALTRCLCAGSFYLRIILCKTASCDVHFDSCVSLACASHDTLTVPPTHARACVMLKSIICAQ